MVVILIVAMISTVAGVKYMSYLETAKVAATKTQISQFKAAVEAFYLFENSYPDSLEDLIHGTDNHPAGYLDAKSVPKDPWGNPYEYEVTDEIETPFVVISYGADKTEGGDGNNADIRSDNLSGSAE